MHLVPEIGAQSDLRHPNLLKTETIVEMDEPVLAEEGDDFDLFVGLDVLQVILQHFGGDTLPSLFFARNDSVNDQHLAANVVFVKVLELQNISLGDGSIDEADELSVSKSAVEKARCQRHSRFECFPRSGLVGREALVFNPKHFVEQLHTDGSEFHFR